MKTRLNITETHKRAMKYMAAESAVVSVWAEFETTTGPMMAKIDRAGNMHHLVHLSKFASEDAKVEWMLNIEG